MNSGTPEELSMHIAGQIISGELDINSLIGTLHNTLNDMDNEMRIQVLISSYVNYLKMRDIIPGMSGMSDDEFAQVLKIGFIATGMVYHYRDIPRSELNTIVYYAKITPELETLRCQFHPLHLMTMMPPGSVPASFTAMFNDANYLPNIITAHDLGGDTIRLITFQKTTVHFDAGEQPHAEPFSDDLD